MITRADRFGEFNVYFGETARCSSDSDLMLESSRADTQSTQLNSADSRGCSAITYPSDWKCREKRTRIILLIVKSLTITVVVTGNNVSQNDSFSKPKPESTRSDRFSDSALTPTSPDSTQLELS